MKKFITLALIFAMYNSLQAQKTNYKSIKKNSPKIEFYGFVRSDFYYNSRISEEGIDGVFHFFPKPILMDNGQDKHAIPQANMLSIASRLGVDIQGKPIGRAKSNGKIEADFAGHGSANYVLRIRQAYMLLDWKNSSLLIGQTWHPLWGSVIPTTLSLNAGMPFQPFNRSPQLLLTQELNNRLTVKLAAIYQMQYTSSGPDGFSPDYLRNAIVPELFSGFEFKTKKWISGIGADFKMIKPDINNILYSFVGTAYSQYSHNLFCIKGKVTVGQNLSDQLMANGYGKTYDVTSNTYKYTNMNLASKWLNIIYGKKIQLNLFGGYSHNLGSNEILIRDELNLDKITLYSRGFYFDSQELIDNMYRISGGFTYNLSSFSFGIEYNLTAVQYGLIQSNGRTANNYWINNHRAIASVIYMF